MKYYQPNSIYGHFVSQNKKYSVLSNFSGEFQNQILGKTIRILSWNARYTETIDWYDEADFDACGPLEYRCRYSSDYTEYNESDVILIDAFYLLPREFPRHRLDNQKWVFNGYESPDRSSWPSYGLYDSWFNFTMTYTGDSDVFTPYGVCFDTESPASGQNLAVRNIYGSRSQPYKRRADLVVTDVKANFRRIAKQLESKRLGAIWLVSNCLTKSFREAYVNALVHHYRVDVFGTCNAGRLSVREVERLMRDEYRFYLAFENSLCEDYVTEKLFKTFSLNIVPVVLGNVDYASILPPHSYIDVRDYGSARDLGRYLNYLSTNSTAYAEYFAWKKRYVCFNGVPTPSPACRLCQYLNTNYGVKTKVKSISEFWSRKRRCKSANVFYKGIL